MTNFFDEGGWTMFPTMLFGALTVLSSLLLATRPERRFVPMFLSLSALTIMTGFLGTMWGVTGLVKAYANANPADVKMIMTACATQALNSLLLAFVLVVVGVLGATSGALRVALTRPAAA
jgi:hypothetical protein